MNNLIEDYFDFDKNFSEYVAKTTFLKKQKVVFLVFDDDFSNIVYSYKVGIDNEISFDKYMHLLKRCSNIGNMFNIEFFKYIDDRCLDKNPIYIANIVNPFIITNKNILGTLILLADNKISENDISQLNLNYLLNIYYYTYTIICNYDRLYYDIDIFTELIVAKDKYMPYHMTNVANLSLQLGIRLKLLEKEQKILYFSSLLHDIGKLFISDNIINKEGKLTDDEYKVIKSHCQKGEEIINTLFNGLVLLSDIPSIIRSHHERYDGQGYPDSIKGEEIPLLSRIITVADSVDAMSSVRSYKNKFNVKNIISELEKGSGNQFDPAIAQEMINILKENNIILTRKINSEHNFIPKVSLSFRCFDDKKIVSVMGNLINNKNGIKFIMHDSEKKIFSIKEMTEVSINFMEEEDIIEYKVCPVKISGNEIQLKDFLYRPTDKTFSMLWDGKFKLVIKEKGTELEGEYVKLGGDSVAFKCKNDISNKIIENINNTICLNLNESFENIILNFIIQINIVKFYRHEEYYIFIGRYMDIKSNEKDKIIRMLFRKQMSQRREREKGYIK